MKMIEFDVTKELPAYNDELRDMITKYHHNIVKLYTDSFAIHELVTSGVISNLMEEIKAMEQECKKSKTYKQALDDIENYCKECNLKADFTACDILQIIEGKKMSETIKIDGKVIKCPCYIDRPLHSYNKGCLIQSQVFGEQQTQEKPILRCDEIKNCPIKEQYIQLCSKEQECKELKNEIKLTKEMLIQNDYKTNKNTLPQIIEEFMSYNLLDMQNDKGYTIPVFIQVENKLEILEDLEQALDEIEEFCVVYSNNHDAYEMVYKDILDIINNAKEK